MRKILYIFLLIFLVGCEQKQPPKVVTTEKIKIVTLPPLVPKKKNYSEIPLDPKISGSLYEEANRDNPYAYPIAAK